MNLAQHCQKLMNEHSNVRLRDYWCFPPLIHKLNVTSGFDITKVPLLWYSAILKSMHSKGNLTKKLWILNLTTLMSSIDNLMRKVISYHEEVVQVTWDDIIMPTITPKRPNALPNISMTNIFTNSVEFWASDKAQLLPIMPTHILIQGHNKGFSSRSKDTMILVFNLNQITEKYTRKPGWQIQQ